MYTIRTVDGFTYENIVPQHHSFDSETADLIYGDQLKNGMIVILESHRGDESTPFPDMHPLLPVTNRWCEVTKLRSESGGMVMPGDDSYFIGVYEDGRRAVRSSSPTQGWFVKKYKPEAVNE